MLNVEDIEQIRRAYYVEKRSTSVPARQGKEVERR
jgi:hypothetical protein